MLIATIHDVAPQTLEQVRALRDWLDGLGVDRATLLAVPNFHGEAPLWRHPETATWLRERRSAGDEIALHGYYHRQSRAIPSTFDRVRSRLFTAGEGECLSLLGSQRDRLLERGRAIVEDASGGAVSGFVAPAWLEPRGFADALARAGFDWHETGMWIESLRPARRRRALSPALGFATRTALRRMAAIAWARSLAPLVDQAARHARAPIRIALHPADLTSRQVMNCAGEVVARLRAHHQPATTEAFLDARRHGSARPVARARNGTRAGSAPSR